jgi:hypothetical protein
MVQPSWVHVAVSTDTVLAPVRVNRKLPSDVCTLAIEPVDAKGELAPTATVTVRPETVADTELSGDDDADGDVGLPPHPAAPAMARKAADLLQLAQKSRRVVVVGFVRSLTAVTSLGQKSAQNRGLPRYQQEP